MCCLLGAKIHDVAKRAAQLAKSMLLLLFHVGADDTASQKMGRIKEDYKVLVRQVENASAQVPIYATNWRNRDRRERNRQGK